MKRLTLSAVAGLLLLGGTTAVAQDDPQQIVIDPLQHTMNGARVALVKGVFYMGIPIVVPLPPPTLCDLVLKFGARFEEWGENDPPIGRLGLRTYSGGIATSSRFSPGRQDPPLRSWEGRVGFER